MLVLATPVNPLLKPGRKIKLRGHTYAVAQYVGGGGSGQVYKVTESSRTLALKVFFPFYQLQLGAAPTDLSAGITDSLKFQRQEYEFLSLLSHPNIVRVYEAGDVTLTAAEQKLIPVKDVTKLPVMVTDFVDGYELKNAIRQYRMTASEVRHVLMRVAYALRYLHADRRYMHVDIKSENILVRRSDREPILIDFALAKNLNFAEVGRSAITRLLGDWDLFPKDLPTDHRLKKLKESNGTREELFNLAFPGLDLYQFGKLLTSLQSTLERILAKDDRDYLSALAERMTTWDIVRRWRPIDLPPHIERIGPEPYAALGVPELASTAAAPRTIMLPTGDAVPLSALAEEIVDGRSFRRLTLINQLSLLSQVYPGSDYKRSVHALHAYHLARAFVSHLSHSALFRVLFDELAVRQLLITALLHDINHFPFLHTIQESQIPGLTKLQVLDLFCSGEATGEIDSGSRSVYDLLGDVELSSGRFKRIIFGEHHEQRGSDAEVDQVISSLLNSGVDIDKLSYLTLDAHFTGVAYGRAVDLPTILKGATLRRLPPEDRAHLVFTERAIQALEAVVMARFWNFRSIYWHHTNRALMAMILHVVRRLYVEQNRPVEDYLRETLWATDVEAVKYLDDRHYALFRNRSILYGLLEERRRLFRRLYTVRAGLDDPIDDALFVDFKALSYEAEKIFRSHIAEGLSEFLGAGGDGLDVEVDEILVDIPRREMDSGGNVWIDIGDGAPKPLASLSDPIRAINANYEQLAKRVRVFISPRIASILGERRDTQRKAIQTVVKSAMDDTRGRSQVS